MDIVRGKTLELRTSQQAQAVQRALRGAAGLRQRKERPDHGR